MQHVIKLMRCLCVVTDVFTQGPIPIYEMPAPALDRYRECIDLGEFFTDEHSAQEANCLCGFCVKRCTAKLQQQEELLQQQCREQQQLQFDLEQEQQQKQQQQHTTLPLQLPPEEDPEETDTEESTEEEEAEKEVEKEEEVEVGEENK